MPLDFTLIPVKPYSSFRATSNKRVFSDIFLGWSTLAESVLVLRNTIPSPLLLDAKIMKVPVLLSGRLAYMEIKLLVS